ncbi:hypothetical protein ACHHYP_20187 [Achlya hypogyna]|uniref:Uncharacterized protein n=1 Tax=Achlya hypogyna TaxID=1202772 RepID=A0A1V9Z064_ACHHY|nr:hypothetical protein ACHHYP_20187 [Achlya hypogyna]
MDGHTVLFTPPHHTGDDNHFRPTCLGNAFDVLQPTTINKCIKKTERQLDALRDYTQATDDMSDESEGDEVSNDWDGEDGANSE